MIFITRRSVDSEGAETPKRSTIVLTISEKLKSNAHKNLLCVFESSEGAETPKRSTIVLTISEKLKSNAHKNLLCVFESDQQHTVAKTIFFKNSPLVVFGERTDSIEIIEGGDSTETITGTVKISPAGFYSYKIYQQNSSTNLDVNDSSVVALLEQGKLTVLDTDELTTTEHTNTVDNFIHINS